MAQGIELASAYISLIPSAKGMKANLERELGPAARQAGNQAGAAIEDGLSSGASRGAAAARTAISAIGSAAILSGLNKAKDAASGLQQAVGGTAAVFGEASEAVDEFAESAAESVGLSQQAARELTSQLGASLKGYGFAVDEAADKSIELTKIGADLAATFGGTTAEAVGALSSALRGEFDPLERFGIALRQSTIDAEAQRLGLAAAGEEVSAYARAQAALALITEQAGGAIGQFARESDSAAGMAQISAAKQQDAAASLGDSLLPIYAKISETVGQVADVFAALPAPIQTGILALAGVAAVAGPITNVIGLYRTFGPTAAASLGQATAATATYNAVATNSAASVAGLYASGGRATSVISRLGSTFAAAGIAAAGATVAIGLWSDAVDNARDAAAAGGDRIRQAFATDVQTAEDFNRALGILADSQRDFASASEQAFNPVTQENMGRAADEVANIYNEMSRLIPVANALAAQTGDLDEATRLVVQSSDDVIAKLDEGYTPAQAAAAVAVEDRRSAEQRAATVTEAFGDETRTALQSTDAYREAVDELNSALSDYLNIGDSLVVTQDDFSRLLRETADTTARLNEEQASGADRRSEFLDFLQDGTAAAEAVSQALLEQGESTDVVNLAMQSMIQQLFDQAEAFGVSRSEANELRDELDLLPRDIALEISSNTPEVIAQLDTLQGRIEHLVNRAGFISLGEALNGPLKPRAAGGPVMAGASYLVGENEPEILTIGASGFITPLSTYLAPVVDAPASAGAGVTVVGQPTEFELRLIERAAGAAASTHQRDLAWSVG